MKMGRIFYDHYIKLWTLLVYDENGNPLEGAIYEHHKSDIKKRITDFPAYKKWEVYTRNGKLQKIITV